MYSYAFSAMHVLSARLPAALPDWGGWKAIRPIKGLRGCLHSTVVRKCECPNKMTFRLSSISLFAFDMSCVYLCII